MFEEVILPQLLAVGVALIVGLAVGALVGFLVGRFLYPHCPSNLESFYRGLFKGFPDWAVENIPVSERLLAVLGAWDRNRYGEPADGWQWPLPPRVELERRLERERAADDG